LGDDPDERDEGLGIVVEPEGEVHQGTGREPDVDESMPFPRSRHVSEPPPPDE
jgi:hypothetical protein